MSDTLEIFGTEYTGVTGIKATDDNNQTKTYIRPEGTKSISANGNGIDVTAYASVNVNVPSQSPNLQSKTKTYTPSESSQSETVTADSGYDGLSSVSVSVGAISNTYVGSGIARKSSTDLTVSGATVTAPAGYYSASASKSVANGTAGTPTATKGTVSNHSVSITPSVTNTSGYITGGTRNGTAVSVSASELVSGSQTITENGTVDVTNLAEVVVDVSGGGGGSNINVAVGTPQSGANTYLQFGDLLGEPTSFSIIYTNNITIDDDPVVSALTYDGINYVGQIVTPSQNAQASYLNTGFSHNYNYGGILISSNDAAFATYSNYKMVYTYGGSRSDIKTADVQVGSGATSITFPVSGNPKYWSCIFKSDFSTSSGYQRVIGVANDGTNTYGMALDSSAKALTSWTASYSGGNLTITSQGTNNGGYFHQPGYYQLTYVTDSGSGGGGNYQTKTVTPTTQQQTVTPDSGYDALSEVTVNAIPNTYVQPTSTVGATTYRASTSNQTIQAGTYHSGAGTIAAVTQTNLTAANIKEGTTITISNGQSNLWSVTGTYSGESSKNVQAYRGYATVTATSYTATAVTLTVAKTGTYNVSWMGFRNTNSGTSGSQLYRNGTAVGSAQTTFVSTYGQSVSLTNQSFTQGDVLVVRARARSTSYVMGVGNLIIEEV